MDKAVRDQLQRATQEARALLSKEFGEQLEGVYDILPDGHILEEPGGHLSEAGRVLRRKLIAAVEHKQAGGIKADEAVQAFLREAAFTMLNRFVALKMLEARGLVQECVSRGEQSPGFKEFSMLAPGLADLPDKGYRLYIESLFDEIGREVRVLFDRGDAASLLWPRRQAFVDLLDILNREALVAAWKDEEAIGWIYQYFNAKDEIREMRDAGRSGPRNSREMAVRNQFFTPDYVVQFLVDNTLGRVWVEMTKGDTDLLQHLSYYNERSNEHFLAEGERVEAPEEGATYVPHRPMKDPREIRLLDPACGSMHFGLHAFSVYETIYLEAWDRHPALLADLREILDRDAFHRLVPRLILEHNIHGVDIDPRALQIAGLALWLRAQRSWQAQGVKPADRPRIRRSHLVCAEPMPGGEGLLEELRTRLERQYPANGKLLGELVAEVWSHMRLAGEAGPLLKIEQELEGAIQRAKKIAETARQGNMFGDGADEEAAFSVEGISRRFFYGEGPLPAVLSALHDLATAGEGTDGYRRQLFEEDAAQGLAFIELLRQKYDIVVMNPPFGDASIGSKKYIEEAYTDAKNDVLQAFVERVGELLVPGGYLGAITSRTSFFLSQAQSWRERVVLRLFRPELMVDFGLGVLDAWVETAAYILRSLTESEDRALTLSLVPDLVDVERTKSGKFSIPKYQKTRREPLKRHQAERELERLIMAGLVRESSGRGRSFELVHNAIKQAKIESNSVHSNNNLICFRLIDKSDKEGTLLTALNDKDSDIRFEADTGTFQAIPNSPFAYWVSNKVRDLFRFIPSYEDGGRETKLGLRTADDFRFVRCWWEISPEERCHPESHPLEFEGSYCVRGAKWFSFAKGGAHSRFYSDVYLVINYKRDGHELKSWAESLYDNTSWSRMIQAVDYYFRPGLTWSRRSAVGLSTRYMPQGCVFSDKGPLATTSRDEVVPLLALTNSEAFRGLVDLQMAVGSFEVGVFARTPTPMVSHVSEDAVSAVKRAVENKMLLQASNCPNHLFVAPTLAHAEIDLATETREQESRVMIYAELQAKAQEEANYSAYELYGIEESDRYNIRRALGSITIDVEDAEGEEEAVEVDSQSLVHDLVSYTFGVAFGRWDVHYATGKKVPPPLPDPFDPLPVCPPGLLQDTSTGLPLNAPPPGYPVAFPEDGILVDDPGHERDVLDRIHDVLTLLFENPSAIEAEAAELLGEIDLRSYFRKSTGFFEAHRKQYSKSRRKAPIYWPLSTASGSYTVWLYYPRLTHDTFYRVLEVAIDKVRHEEGVLRDLKQEIGPEPSASQRRDIAMQEGFVAELRQFQQEIERIGPLWQPNLNDGVIINFAQLHRLANLNRPWQKDLQKTWKELVKGDYDWSHLAMHLWPERVIPQCAKRRDLAIAHGLEDVFWKQNADGNWEARDKPTLPVDDLILERTSPSVKAALESLVTR